MDSILAVPDVAWAASTLDGRTFVNTFEHGIARRPQLEALLGPNKDIFEATATPRPTTLGRIDMKVLRELVRDPRASITQLSERTGLSPKTVRSHRAGLIGQRYVRVDPLLRPPWEPGRLFYHMSVKMDDARRIDPTIKAIPDSIPISTFKVPPAAYLFCTAAGIAEQAAHQKMVERLDGVVEVKLLINQTFGMATQRLLNWCDEAIAAWG